MADTAATVEKPSNVIDIATGEDRVYSSVDDFISYGANEVQYKTIAGFKEGTLIRIGSISAGELIAWTEAGEGEAKRTAGLRLICQSLVGPEPGNVRYASDLKNIAKFRGMRTNVTERIIREILKLNGMGKAADEESKKD